MNVKMEDMTWSEIEEAIEDGRDTVLIMLGSIEQHGPHLPINTDTLISDELGVRIAEKLGDTLVAPTIRPGCSDHHMDFAGTISLSKKLLMEIIEEYCLSLDKHGFKNIVLIPFHGGNYEPVEMVGPKIKKELEHANLISYTDLDHFMEMMKRGMEEIDEDYSEPVIHAGAGETAVLMAIDENLVRKDRMEKGYEGELPVGELFIKGLKHFTESGILGDPNRGNKEGGEAILEKISEYFYEKISEDRE